MVELYGRSGGELTVNTTQQGRQTDPLTAPRCLLAASSSSGPIRAASAATATTFPSRASFNDEDGARVGSEFLVNTSTAGAQTATGIAALAGGGFVVTFRECRRDRRADFDSPGAKSGGEIPIAPASGFADGEHGRRPSVGAVSSSPGTARAASMPRVSTPPARRSGRLSKSALPSTALNMIRPSPFWLRGDSLSAGSTMSAPRSTSGQGSTTSMAWAAR